MIIRQSSGHPRLIFSKYVERLSLSYIKHIMNFSHINLYLLFYYLIRSTIFFLQTTSLTDCLIMCEDYSLKAHKVVLAACSPYLYRIFEEHPGHQPTLVLKVH